MLSCSASSTSGRPIAACGARQRRCSSSLARPPAGQRDSRPLLMQLLPSLLRARQRLLEAPPRGDWRRTFGTPSALRWSIGEGSVGECKHVTHCLCSHTCQCFP